MAIDLKRFVDINLEYHKTPSVTSTRDTVVLFSSEDGIDDGTVYSALSEVPSSATLTYKYATVYFNNGGAKLMVKKPTGDTLAKTDIEALANEYIVVAYANSTDNYNTMKSVSKALAEDSGEYDPNTSTTAPAIYGSNQKILLAYTSTATAEADTLSNNLAVKYSSEAGTEMAIAAYLSRIDISEADSVQDYQFTIEDVTAEDLTEAQYTIVFGNNWLIDTELANEIRNVGSNLVDGTNLVNQYVLILLHQTATEAVVKLLATKIKGQKGLSAIYSTLAQELNRYVNCGYLTTDRVWTYDTWTITYNDSTYTVIEKGTALTQGYSIMIVPWTSVTEEDRSAGKAPPIYIVVATSTGIGKVAIGGEVI